MSSDMVREDPVLAALRELSPCDVPPARAARLRARCHKGLAAQNAARRFSRHRDSRVWGRSLRVLASAWCVVYAFETVRRAVAIIAW